MRRLALLPVIVLLTSGCGWTSLLLGGSATSVGPITVSPPPIQRCRVVSWDGIPRPCHEVLPSAIVDAVPAWVKRENLPPKALPGAKLFALAGCTACHTYLGAGGRNLGAPDLTAIGTRHLGVAFEIRHLKCPACVVPGSPMPSFRSLAEKRLRDLAIFLEASKGVLSGPSAPSSPTG
jgi:hypothetical protein